MKKYSYSILSKVIATFMLVFSVVATQAQVKPSTDCPPNNRPSFNNGCGTSTNGYIRDFFTTGGINNITNNGTNCGNTTTSYSDYTGTNMKVTQNAGASITANVRWIGGTNVLSAYVRIYIDWNNDGDLQDAGEYIAIPFTPPSPNPHVVASGSLMQYPITVPGYAKEGLLRMRVVIGATFLVPDLGTSACGTANYGEAEDYTIEVINPCLPPNVISISNVDFESGDFSWTQKLNASFYEYVITPVDTIPHDTVIGFTFTTDNTVDVDTFQCNTKYYVLVRIICDTVGKAAIDWDKSVWVRDSFTTPACCYDPVVTVDKITHNTARASWAAVATAVGYEYGVSTTTTPPQSATYTINNSVLLQGLSSKVTYFLFVRTRCSPTPLSDWAQASFKTMKTTSVDEINSEDFYIQAYPSPMQNVLNVNITGEIGKNASLTVVDLTGKVVYAAPVASNEVSIDVSSLASGIYVVKYTDDTHNKIMRVAK